MKIFKQKWHKSYNAVIAFFITFLGFNSACDEIGGGKVAYGTPSADFIINGKIVSEEGNIPIGGIKVELIKEFKTDNYAYQFDSAYSAPVDGSYKVMAARDFPTYQTYLVRFTDVDGVQNGEYESLDTTVVFQNPEFSNGSGSWYAGETETEFNVKLRPKQ